MNSTHAPAKFLSYLLVILCCLVTTRVSATYIVVDKNGTGQYTTVQAAIDNAPVATSPATADTIFIKDGRYKEKITIPSNKPYIVMIGESVANTILTYDDGASTIVNGAPLGTQNSASFTINANDFTALNITFVNSFGDGSQGVTVLANADRVAFKNCRFLGNQDTLYIKGAGTPKHYFRNCYIDGNVDFIFGSSIAVFDSCVIYGKVKPGITSTYIAAPNTPAGQSYGLVFRGCQVTGNTTAGYYYLGRPWQAAPRATYLSSRVYNNMILPAGWSSNSAGSATIGDAYFEEYQTRYHSGALVDVTQRIAGTTQLTATAAAGYTLANMFGTWDPCPLVGCGSFTPSIAIANIKATKGPVLDTIRWNISWPVTGVQYQLYRSTDSINFSPVTSQVITATDDTTWNFEFRDAIPPQGSIYWYYVKGTKTGYATYNSDIVKISSAPTILTTGTFTAFTQYIGGPSGPQTYTVSGTDLTANVNVTAPANYQVSSDGGTTYNTSVTLTPASGTLASTTLYVRLNAGAIGNSTGNLVHTSTGAVSVNIPLTGATLPQPTIVSNVLEYWPLTADNLDSAAVRDTNIVPTTPTLSKLYLSTATAVTTIPAYSATYGQALGASSTADGAWGTAAGGPGGNLNRAYYEQFTIKATTGDSLRVDSLILNAAFYQTSSNTKLAVVYSRSNFVSDSTDVSGGLGLGIPLLNTANGSFANPVLLANQSTGPTNNYRLALNSIDGVKVDTGGTLTIRLYFSCSSTSNGRYGMLKNVMIKGKTTAFVACVPPVLSTAVTHVSCAGNGNIALTTTGGTAPFTYSWTGPSGYTSNTQSPSNLAAGIYTVTVTAAGGCTATKTDTITTTPFAATLTALNNTTVCAGDTVRLKASTGTGFTYSWKRGTATIPGATDSIYTATASGAYTVTISSGTCSATSPAVTVTVHPRPVTTVTASGSLNFCTGDSVKLQAARDTAYTYQWKRDGSNISGATDSGYVARTTGSYRVKITSSSGCADSSIVFAVVAQALPVPVIAYTGGVLTTGTYSNYQWYLNGTAVPGATNATLTPGSNGDYTVKVDSGSCSATSMVYTVSGVGVKTVSINGRQVVIYPNPAVNIVYIDAAAMVNIQLRDISGRTVGSWQQTNKIDIGQLAPGVYMMSLFTADGLPVLTQRVTRTGN